MLPTTGEAGETPALPVVSKWCAVPVMLRPFRFGRPTSCFSTNDASWKSGCPCGLRSHHTSLCRRAGSLAPVRDTSFGKGRKKVVRSTGFAPAPLPSQGRMLLDTPRPVSCFPRRKRKWFPRRATIPHRQGKSLLCCPLTPRRSFLFFSMDEKFGGPDRCCPGCLRADNAASLLFLFRT